MARQHLERRRLARGDEPLPRDGELVAHDEDTRRAFLQGLSNALDDGRLSVIVTLRADLFDRPLRYPEFGNRLKRAAIPIVEMSVRELTHAVTEPAAAVGLEVEPALLAKLVDDVTDRPAGLPELQFALTELCEQRTGSVIGLAAYEAIGGVGAAVASRAESLLAASTAVEIDVCRRLFLRLVTTDRSGATGARQARRADLRSIGQRPDDMDELIDRFVDARLLTTDRESTTREPTVELSHEALIAGWPRLAGWIDEAGELLRVQTQLVESAAAWEDHGRDDAYLLRGIRLDGALGWAETQGTADTTTERQLIEASEALRRHEEAAERRVSRRLRRLLAAVAIGLVVAVIAGAVALVQRGQANDNAREARIRELVNASGLNLDVDPTLSLLLAAEASDLAGDDDAPDIEQVLHDALLATRLVATVPAGFEGIADFLPDGRSFIASAGAEGENVVRWSVDPVEPLQTFVGPSLSVSDAAVSNDGSLVVAASLDSRVWIWDVESGELARWIETGELVPVVPVFSNDGAWVAATLTDFGGRSDTVVWDVATGEEVFRFAAPEGVEEALNIEFSPDDSLLAVTYFVADGAVPGPRVWDLATGEVAVYEGHEGNATDVEFTPDGSRLVSVSVDATARVWDVATGEEVGVFGGHDGPLRDVELSADGTVAASAGLDVKVWSLADFREIAPIVGHEQIDGLDFSPDGTLLVTASFANSNAKLWHVSPAGSYERFAVPGPTETIESGRGLFDVPVGVSRTPPTVSCWPQVGAVVRLRSGGPRRGRRWRPSTGRAGSTIWPTEPAAGCWPQLVAAG